ncbi:MAG: FkbM family methyltransferase [Lachnospiraceae bacterium]|nr:FkbM family methyltransferase [Lachnospiraceae bacterium]
MTKENKQAESMLQTLVKTTDYLRKNNLKTVNEKMKPAFKQIYGGISSLTESFYGSAQLEGNKVLDNLTDAMEHGAALSAFFDEFDKWKGILMDDLDALNEYSCNLDQDFAKIMVRIHNVSRQDMIENLKKELNKIRSKSVDNYRKIVEFHNSFSYYWGKLDPDNNVYERFESCVDELKENAERYTWLYSILADYRSKKVLYGILKFWLDLDYAVKNTLVEKSFAPYLDLDVLGEMSDKEVILDCGAYKGNSILAYLDNFSSFQKAYAYEMVPSLCEKMKEELKDVENVEIHNAAITSNGMSKKKIFINDNPSLSTTSLLDPENAAIYDSDADVPNKPDSKVPIDGVPIDKDIAEPVTYIKMDIEGSEMDAIKGGKNHIKYDKPKLAIAAYHKYSDLWEIPENLSKLNSKYKFYLRYYGATNGYTASEYVLYAI